MQTEEVEEAVAEWLKKEILTTARCLRIKGEENVKRTEQESDEEKSRGRRFIALRWGENGRQIRGINV